MIARRSEAEGTTEMNSLPIWALETDCDDIERISPSFRRETGERVLDFAKTVPKARTTAPSGVRKAFKRLLGTLSLADLNEYREAAGQDPELDARCLYALHDAADRFFPVRNDETGGRFLRNAYLKYLSEHLDIAEIARGLDAGPSAGRRSAGA